jgi:SAM-dependent methyltransferase
MICYCCGSSSFTSDNVLWQELINQWRISNYEAEYINKQHGNKCTKCHSNFRSIALAFAIMKSFDYVGLFKDFVKEERIQNLRILEINEAGNLTHFLQQIPNHTLSIYPESDMMNMKFPDMSFDLVLHSDVLEHIKYPIRGLSECYRILKPGGYCAFTIPMIVDRLTISREGMPPSYHGSSDNLSDDLIVHTEYGCDSWRQVIQAGFQQCRLFSIDYPSSLALVAVK